MVLFGKNKSCLFKSYVIRCTQSHVIIYTITNIESNVNKIGGGE